MKSKTVIIVLIGSFHFSSNAQSPLYGHADFNDAGIYAVVMNPASGSNTPDKLSINLTGAGFLFSSNTAKTNLSYSLLEIATAKPLREGNSEFSSPYFKLTDKNVKHPSVYLNAEILLPSFKVNINPRLSVFGLLRERVVGNLTNISGDVIQIMSDNSFSIENGISATFRLKAMAFQQAGLGFSSTLFQKHEHLIKAGATLNFDKGMGLYILSLDQFDFRYDKKNLSLNSEYKESMMDQNHYTKNDNTLSYFSQEALGKGVHTDWGIIYEFRPYSLKNTYSRYNAKGKNKNFISTRTIRYLFKVSASLRDLGTIKFSNGIKNKGYSVHTIMPFDSFQNNTNPGYVYSLIDRISNRDSSSGINIKLPAVATISFDYNLKPGWFLNFVYTQNLRFKKTLESFSQPSTLQFSVRKESDKFSYSLPIYVIPSQKIFNFGFIMKAGPLFISTYNIRSLFSKKMQSFSLAAGLVFTIKYRHDPTIESNNW